MSDCDKFKAQISDYLEGELTLESRKKFENHLAICSLCNEIVKQIRIIQQNLSHVPRLTTSPDFEFKLHQQIYELDGKPSFLPQPFQNWKLPAMGSALVLATVGLFFVFNQSVDTNNPASLSSPDKMFNPAASKLPGNQTGNPSGQKSGAASQFESSTLINDSLITDSSRIQSEGIQLIRDKK